LIIFIRPREGGYFSLVSAILSVSRINHKVEEEEEEEEEIINEITVMI